MKMYFNPAHKG